MVVDLIHDFKRVAVAGLSFAGRPAGAVAQRGHDLGIEPGVDPAALQVQGAAGEHPGFQPVDIPAVPLQGFHGHDVRGAASLYFQRDRVYRAIPGKHARPGRRSVGLPKPVLNAELAAAVQQAGVDQRIVNVARRAKFGEDPTDLRVKRNLGFLRGFPHVGQDLILKAFARRVFPPVDFRLFFRRRAAHARRFARRWRFAAACAGQSFLDRGRVNVGVGEIAFRRPALAFRHLATGDPAGVGNIPLGLQRQEALVAVAGDLLITHAAAYRGIEAGLKPGARTLGDKLIGPAWASVVGNKLGNLVPRVAAGQVPGDGCSDL